MMSPNLISLSGSIPMFLQLFSISNISPLDGLRD